MDDLSKEAAYLKGLAEGLDIDKKSPEGRIILKMLELMNAMSEKIDSLSDALSETSDVLDDVCADVIGLLRQKAGMRAIDDDYGDGDDDYMDDDELFDEFGDQDDLYEMECPHCHEDVMIEFDMINDDNSIICPNCHKEIPLEFGFDEDFEEE